jgi:hypothetical protein
MIEVTVKLDGINLDVQHDGEIIHDVTFYSSTESLLSILNQHARHEIEEATGKRFYRPRPDEVLPDPLIGAAPDLLEACKESLNALLDYVETLEMRGGQMNYGRKVVSELVKAIAKAEGTP